MTNTINLAEELRTVPVFADLAANDLEWLAAQTELVELEPGDILVYPRGSPAERMMIILEGAVRLRVESATSG